jgi:hypothetical protein
LQPIAPLDWFAEVFSSEFSQTGNTKVARFIFIHGTFTQQANWPALTAGITKACENLKITAVFDKVTWTGHNSFKAREAAAESIADRVKSAIASDPNEPVFAIAHSHGGSALAHYLKMATASSLANSDLRALAMMPAGCAFLSTPFVAMRQRKNATQLMAALFTLPMLLVTFLFMHISPAATSSVEPIAILSNTLWWQWLFYSTPGISLAIFGLFVRYAEINSYGVIMLTQTCNMPRGNNIFLRFPGDEAAAALAATQFFAWVGSKIARFARRYLLIDYFLANVFLNTVVTGTFAIVYGTILVSVYNAGLGETVNAMADYVIAAFKSFDLRGIGVCFFVGGAILLAAMISIAVATAIFCFIWQALATRAFGWSSLMHGFVIELAVEPLPFGENKLYTMNWEIGPSDNIVHSWTYEDTRAIDYIEKWIAQSMSEPKKGESP